MRLKWLLLVGLCPACMTPMSQREIETLTTCHSRELKQIRKSLLLNGYEIKSETEDELITEYKQVSGYGRDSRARRITVVRIDDDSFRFHVRLRDVRLETRNDHDISLQSNDQKAKGRSGIYIDLTPPMEIVTESDQSYYEEWRDQHYSLQREVCG